MDKQEEASLSMRMMESAWKNRRKMAWISFKYALGYPALVIGSWFFDPDLADKVLAIAVPVYAFLGTVMVAYFGLSTWDDVQTRKQP